MNQDTFYHAVLLSQPCHFHKALIRIIAVCLQRPFHPVRRTMGHITGYAVFHKRLDMATANGHVDDSDTDIFRQSGHQCTPEVIHRSKSRIGTAKRWYGRIPMSLLAFPSGIVHRSHHAETFVHSVHIPDFGTCIPLHVRLSETEEDIEIRIGFSAILLRPSSHGSAHHTNAQYYLFHRSVSFSAMLFFNLTNFLHKSLPLGRGKQAFLCARLIAIFTFRLFHTGNSLHPRNLQPTS